MRRIKRSGITALTAAIALSLGAIPVVVTAGMFPGGDSPTTVTPATTVPFKTMVLQTGASDRVFLDLDADGTLDSGEPSQGLEGRSRDCRLVTPSGNLLAFAGSFASMAAGDNAVSYASDSLGVAEKKSGTSCYQVGSATQEELSLSLTAGLRGATFPLLIQSASLDVELKQGARILATAFRGTNADGTPKPVAYFDLASGAVTRDPLVTTNLPYNADRESCGNSADNGPDSTSGDNCIWPLASEGVLFDSLTLKAWSGDFSLEGGSDWGDPAGWPTATAKRSTFDLVEVADGELNCGQTVTLSSANGGSTPGVTVTRIKNAVNPDQCSPIPYSFSNGSQKAEFLKPLDREASAQFVFDFTWTGPGNTNWNSTAPLLTRTLVDFDSAGTRDAETPIAWCPDLVDSPSVSVAGTPFKIVRDVASNPDAADQAVGYPGTGTADTKQFACIVSQSASVTDAADPASDGPTILEDKAIVNERIYVYGDILLRKG